MILSVTLLTRSFGVIVMFAGLFLLFIAIYALVRGSAKMFRVRSRGAAWAVLGYTTATVTGSPATDPHKRPTAPAGSGSR